MTAMFARRNPRPLLRTALIVVAYLCAFIILDLISRQFEELRGIVAWYPPVGLTYALLLVFGEGFTPAVTITLLISSVFIYHMPQPPYLLLLWALIISSIYGVATAFLRHRIRFDWQLRKSRDVTWLIVTAVFVSALLAVLSVSSSALSSDMPRNEVLRAIFIWWIGETVGVLTITPFLLIHAMPRLKQFAEAQPVRSPARWSFPRPTLSVIGQAFTIAFMFYWVFGARGLDEFRPMYLITLPLIWIALDHGFKGVTTGIVVLNFGVMLAMWFFRLDLAHLGELQLLMIVNCIVGLLVGAVVTERKRAEEDIRSLLRQVQADKDMQDRLLDSMSDEVWFADTTAHFTLANPAACETFSLKSAINTDIQQFAESLEVFRPDGSPRPVQEAPPLRALEGETVTDQEEIVRLPLSGELRYRLVNASPVRDAQRTIIGCVSVVRDITNRKRAEEETVALQAQLQQSQKMDAIGQLAGGVAHDFNNLLTGILGNTAIMRSDLPASDPLVANLNAVETAAHQAADLAKGLLTFSRKAVVTAVPLDMAEAIDTTLDILKQSLPATLEIVRDYEQTVWNVLLDQSQLTQILLNLAVNARDAMNGKGILTIRARNEVVGQEYVQDHLLARAGEFVHLSVTDTGPGMSSEVMQHLFEPFYTTKPAGSGTGLGLSIVYGAVKQAGGWITAVSTDGAGKNAPQKQPLEAPLRSTPQIGRTSSGGWEEHPRGDGKNILGGIEQTCSGATFDIYLPRCLEEPTQSFTPNPPTMDICSGTVLVVEDEPVVCAVAQALLSRSGYMVLTAPDGASALNVLRDHPAGIGLILLDMTMPGMTTGEVVQAIRALDPTVPILLNSGYTSNGTVKQMLEENSVQGFLGKPYELHELLRTIARLLHTTEGGPR
jgi:PAS domain S-box-containing protein